MTYNTNTIDNIQDALPVHVDDVDFTMVGITKSQRSDIAWEAAHIEAVRADGARFDVLVGSSNNGDDWSVRRNREYVGLKVGDFNPVFARGVFDGFAAIAAAISGIEG